MENLFWIVVLSLPILPNLWCIWHAARHDFPMPGERTLWIRAGTFAPIIGGILYLCIGCRRARPLRQPDIDAASAPRTAADHMTTDPRAGKSHDSVQ